jgi:hypothetical protein
MSSSQRIVPPALSITADLRLDLDGTKAHLVGDGQSLILHSSDPLRLWSALNQASVPAGIARVDGPRAVGRAADALLDNGLRVDVTGPHGVLVRLGQGADSRAGRLITGSSGVEFGSARALGATIRAEVPAGRIALAAAAIVAAVVLFAVKRRR